MKRVKLTGAQHAWICCKMRDSYRKANLELQDLNTPSTISFYERYNAMNIYRELIDLHVRQCRFLEDMWEVMMGKEAQL